MTGRKKIEPVINQIYRRRKDQENKESKILWFYENTNVDNFDFFKN